MFQDQFHLKTERPQRVPRLTDIRRIQLSPPKRREKKVSYRQGESIKRSLVQKACITNPGMAKR